VTEEETGLIWDKTIATGNWITPYAEVAIVQTGVSAVLHKLGVANNCITVERVPFVSDKPTNGPVGEYAFFITCCLCLQIIGSNTWKG
jgi:hypothetical protein